MVCPAGGMSRGWLGIGQGIPQSRLPMAQMDLTRVPSHVCSLGSCLAGWAGTESEGRGSVLGKVPPSSQPWDFLAGKIQG